MQISIRAIIAICYCQTALSSPKTQYSIGVFSSGTPQSVVARFAPVFETYLTEQIGALYDPPILFSVLPVDFDENTSSARLIDAGLIDFLCKIPACNFLTRMHSLNILSFSRESCPDHVHRSEICFHGPGDRASDHARRNSEWVWIADLLPEVESGCSEYVGHRRQTTWCGTTAGRGELSLGRQGSHLRFGRCAVYVC